MHRRLWNSSVFRINLLIYILMLIVPTTGTYFIYSRSAARLEREIMTVYSAQLGTIAKSSDELFASARRIAVDLQYLSSLRKMAAMDAQEFAKDRYTSYLLCKSLGNLTLSNEYASVPFVQIELFFPALNFVVTPEVACDADLYQMRLSQRYDSVDDMWLEKYIAEGTGMPLSSGEWLLQRDATIYYVNRLITSNYWRRGALLVMQFDANAFLNQDSLPLPVYMTASGEAVLYSGSTDELPDSSVFAAAENSGEVIDENGNRYILSTIFSEIIKAKYVLVLPQAFVTARLMEIRQVFNIEIAAVLALCSLLIYVGFKKIYWPLRHVTDRMLEYVPEQRNVHNEFDILDTAASWVNTSQLQMSEKLAQQRKVLTRLLYARLINGFLQEEELRSLARTYEVDLSSSRQVLLLAEAAADRDNLAPTEERSPQKRQALLSALENDLSESQLCAFDLDGKLACLILNGDGASDDALQAHIRKAAENAALSLDARLRIVLCRAVQDPMQLHGAYLEGLSLIEFMRRMGEVGVALCEGCGARVDDCTYAYPADLEQRLFNALRLGDEQAVSEALEQIDLANRRDIPLAPVVLKLLYLDVLGTMLRAANAVHMLRPMDPVTLQQLVSEADPSEVRSSLLELAGEITAAAQEVAKKSRLSARVMRYVETHYADINLSSAQLGEVFDLTPAHLNREFMRQTGESLVDVVNRFRIAQAKRLIQETNGITLVEIAKAVGITNIQTFNRLFSKYEGLTPGKYRELTRPPAGLSYDSGDS